MNIYTKQGCVNYGWGGEQGGVSVKALCVCVIDFIRLNHLRAVESLSTQKKPILWNWKAGRSP